MGGKRAGKQVGAGGVLTVALPSARAKKQNWAGLVVSQEADTRNLRRCRQPRHLQCHAMRLSTEERCAPRTGPGAPTDQPQLSRQKEGTV